MIEYLFKALQYLIAKELPEVKNIDLYFDQFLQQEVGKHQSMSNPRVLIEFGDFDFNDVLENITSADVEVTLHIAIDMLMGTEYKNKSQDKSFSSLALIDSFYTGLNHLNPLNLPDELKSDVYAFSKLRRIRFIMSTDVGSQKIFKLVYRTNIEDHSDERTYIDSKLSAYTKTVTIVNTL